MENLKEFIEFEDQVHIDKNSVFEVGTFWRPFGDGMAREADYMGEGIKSNVEYELDMLDFNQKK